MPKLKLNCQDLFDQVWFVRKTKQDNDVTNYIGVVYVETKNELSGAIESGVICHQNKIGQWHDQPYRCGLHWKWSWAIMNDRTRCSLWWKPNRTMTRSILQMWSTSKMKLRCMTDRIGCGLWKKPDRTTMWSFFQMWFTPKMKLSCCNQSDQVWSIMKTRQVNDMIDHIGAINTENDIEILWLIEPGTICDKN